MRLLLAALLVASCAHRPWEQPGDRWVRVESEHFVVLTDAAGDEYRAVVGRLEDVHAVLASAFFRGVTVSRAHVLLLRRGADFKGLAPKGAGGYYTTAVNAKEGGMMVFPAAGDPRRIEAVAAHELAHRFLSALGTPIPLWLHEGFAMYAESLTILEDRAVFDMAELHGGYVYFSDPVPVRVMLDASYRDFHAEDRVAHYMTAWMMIRHLLTRPGGDPRERLPAFLERIGAAGTADAQAEALEASFGIALAELEREIVSLHRSIYHGIGQPRARGAFAVRYSRPGEPALSVTPADPEHIRALCAALRDHVRGRAD